jgi:NAD(P)-dependent dehydrogenase (short-subunit alcohol dehydrogenase family)
VVEQETGYKKAELWLLDQADFASILAFADKFEKDGGNIDILVANAAVLHNTEYLATNDGWEES